MSERPILSRADLEAFDVPKGAGAEKRSRCPFCRDKEDAFHVNYETGTFNCKRASCGATGQLSDFWRSSKDTALLSKRERAQFGLSRAFGGPLRAPEFHATLPALNAPDDEPARTGNWHDLWENAVAIDEAGAQKGAAYLCGRGITVEVAHTAGVRFCFDWAPSPEGKIYRAGAAVLFPSTNEQGEVVAVNGRYLAPWTSPDGKQTKARTGGDAKQGVFLAPARMGAQWVSPFDRRLDAVILVEGQADALSLAECGFPALAVGGVNLAPWLHRRAGMRRVVIGIDADAGGDKYAPKWEAYLSNYRSECVRLEPENAKDWNEMLAGDRKKGTRGIGRDALTDWLMWRLFDPQKPNHENHP